MKNQKNLLIPDSPCFMTVCQFCAIIKISRQVFYRRLAKAGEKPIGGLLSPNLQKHYCELLGFPYYFEEDELWNKKEQIGTS
jgi:hypothetical protein